MIYDLVNLLRIKHYIKNFMILAPAFFAGSITIWDKINILFIGFVSFSLMASAIYIFNDYNDIEYDRLQISKANRPLVKGTIKSWQALFLFIFIFLTSIVLSVLYFNNTGTFCLLAYLAINLAYSYGFKNIPILDVIILASGYVLRVFFGASIIGVVVSDWLYLVIISLSLYMGLGKRRNELRYSGMPRKVLEYYSLTFLNHYMCVCLTMANVFYALWAIDLSKAYHIWTIPLFIVIMMRYSLDIETGKDGDPVEVITNDKVILMLLFLYFSIMTFSIYIGGLYECV